MIPEKIEHTVEYEAEHLSFAYESDVGRGDFRIEKLEFVKAGLLRDRDFVIKKMRSRNYTEEEIKETLKIAADKNAKYLEQYGIDPSSLY